MKAMYITVRVDYTTPITTDLDDIAELVCERANAHNHTIEDGIKIEKVEFCDINN